MRWIGAVLYFIFVMWWVILFLPFILIAILDEIRNIISAEFAVYSGIGLVFVGTLGLLIGLSLVVPVFRRIYYVFPWMFPYVKILFLNLIIVSVAAHILNYGYEVQNSARHVLFFILMIVQIVASRLAMSYYFYKRPVKWIGGAYRER